MALHPRESSKFISEISKNVTISKEGIEAAAELVIKGFKDQNFCLKSWKNNNELHPQENIFPFAIDWIFLVDTLNFSFWSEESKQYKITFNGKEYTGYWSLCAAINRALKEGYNITSPSYYADITLDTLKYIFRSDNGTEIPLLKERHNILNETGYCLVKNFDSTFATCVALSKNSADNLIKILVEHFPSYRDEACIEGQKVSFYKRGQILVGDIWACFEGKGLGYFHDIDSLTIFADYRVPQVLVYLRTLIYSDDLMKKLKEDFLFENGHRYEVEIRGCTIWACELILQHIKEKQKRGELSKEVFFNSVLIDHYLWEHRRKFAEEMKHIPFHKVRCIYY